MNEDKANKKTNNAIEKTIKIFQRKPYFFLNEEDVKSFLYNKLLENFKDIDIDKKTVSIHCNISSLDDKGKQNFVPDISICDVKSFNTRKDFNFHFNNIFTSIEIKFCINESKNKIIKKLWNPNAKTSSEKGDYYKLCIKEEYNSNILIFDHSSHLNSNDIISLRV